MSSTLENINNPLLLTQEPIEFPRENCGKFVVRNVKAKNLGSLLNVNILFVEGTEKSTSANRDVLLILTLLFFCMSMHIYGHRYTPVQCFKNKG